MSCKINKLFTNIAAGIFLLLAGCTNYEGYQRLKMPDEYLGTVMLPETWEILERDEANDFIRFADRESGNIIAEEYSRGIYISYGNGSVIDERIYNEKFKNYRLKESVESSGNSNGGQYSILRFLFEGEVIETGRLWFSGYPGDSNYSVEFYFLCSVEKETLSKIAKSYQYDTFVSSVKSR